MPRNPYIELYSFIGVGLGRELSFFEKKSLEVENAARLAAERAESASLLVTLGEAAEAGTALEERVVALEGEKAALVELNPTQSKPTPPHPTALTSV